MSLCTFYDVDTGEITGAGDVSAETLALYASRDTAMVQGQAGDKSSHYVDVGKHALTPYSAAEKAALAAMPPGWTWQMPQRRAVDLRSPQRRDDDADVALRRARAKSYPPLADLADALFWQANGDSAPMTVYFARVAAVKAAYPKPLRAAQKE